MLVLKKILINEEKIKIVSSDIFLSIEVIQYIILKIKKIFSLKLKILL